MYGNHTIHVAKTKVLISFVFTEKLIWVFVFTYAKCWFSYDAAQMSMCLNALASIMIYFTYKVYMKYLHRLHKDIFNIMYSGFLCLWIYLKLCTNHFCPPPFRRKAEGHSFWPSVLPSPYRSMYLVCATPPTALFRFF